MASDPLPLILIGSGRTLQLRNVKVVYAASLAACLQLGAGECFSQTGLCRSRSSSSAAGSHQETSSQVVAFSSSALLLGMSSSPFAQPCRLWSGVCLA